MALKSNFEPLDLNKRSKEELKVLCGNLHSDLAQFLRSQKILESNKKELELLYHGEELETVLRFQCAEAEQIYPHMHCSVLKVDQQKKRLFHCASNTLPQHYIEAINGAEMSEGVGSCGTAAFLQRRVIVEDINTHPYWSRFKKFALEAGLQSCWSEPIIASTGEIFGTFAMYYEKPRKPTEEDIRYIENQARIASIIFEHKINQQSLYNQRTKLKEMLDQRTTELQEALSKVEHEKQETELAHSAKNNLLASVLHNIIVPANTIAGFSELLQAHSSNPEVNESLKVIDAAAQQLIISINDYSETFKAETGQLQVIKEETDIQSIVRDIKTALAPEATKKDAILTFKGIDNLPTSIISDPNKLRKILSSLIDNTIMFSSSTEIICHLTYKKDRIGQYEFIIDVKSQGHGISALENNKIFSKSRHQKNALKATGRHNLGLFICREFARKMGGDITFSNEEEKGTCFTFRFKALPGNRKIDSGVSNNYHDVVGLADSTKPVELMVVDHNPHTLLLVKKLLTPLGIQVQAANNSEEALEAYMIKKPSLILISEDIAIPESMNTRKKVTDKTVVDAEPLVIYMINAISTEQQRKLFEREADDLLEKPVNRQQLLALLEKHLSIGYRYHGAQPEVESLNLVCYAGKDD